MLLTKTKSPRPGEDHVDARQKRSTARHPGRSTIPAVPPPATRRPNAIAGARPRARSKEKDHDCRCHLEAMEEARHDRERARQRVDREYQESRMNRTRAAVLGGPTDRSPRGRSWDENCRGEAAAGGLLHGESGQQQQDKNNYKLPTRSCAQKTTKVFGRLKPYSKEHDPTADIPNDRFLPDRRRRAVPPPVVSVLSSGVQKFRRSRSRSSRGSRRVPKQY
ncbi:unnamed protein product [Amoebophrya sp. A120]|nr:unnamed protein product [Amoebophrya sp. A120]|eukprot:GSA120T00013261001.1